MLVNGSISRECAAIERTGAIREADWRRTESGASCVPGNIYARLTWKKLDAKVAKTYRNLTWRFFVMSNRQGVGDILRGLAPPWLTMGNRA
jgi:hypothetical protein